MSSVVISRKPFLAPNVVFIDGLEGCGKTLFSNLISSFNRVEKINYAYEIEFYCSLLHLNKIQKDTLNSMSKMFTDLITYNLMMSRDTNFRPSDISSVFKFPNYFKYLKRLFLRGDDSVIQRVKNENPIIPLTVHKLLINSLPIFEAHENRIKYIEIVRHPLYMIVQQFLNNDNLIYSAKDFSVYFEYNNIELPWYTKGWEEIFLNSSPIDKTIYYIYELGKKINQSKDIISNKFSNQLLTIPFEDFVFNPNKYLFKIENLLDTKTTNATSKVLKKQNVPRKKIADGLALDIYKRCGWIPPQNGLSEREELNLRRNFAIKQGASKKALEILDLLSKEYEDKYMNFLFNNY